LRRAIAGLLGALLMTAGAVDAATVQMFTELITATEGQTVAVRVTRLGTAAGPVTVDWSIADDLVAGVDYGGPTSGTLSWTATDLTPRVISIPLIENAVPEPTKIMQVSLSNPVNATLGLFTDAWIEIRDNDRGFSMLTPDYYVQEGLGTLQFSVYRYGPTTSSASVRWTVANGSAIAGQDFGTRNVATLPTGIAAFAIGESIKTINLPILQDTLIEGPEIFSINLSQPSPGMLLVAPVTASITILDDDIPPESSVAFTQTKIVVLEGQPFAGVGVERTAITSLDRPLTVKYATQAGTALAGSDFSARAGTLTWAAGEGGVKSIRSTLPTLDAVPESPETFKFVLTDVSAGGRIDTPSATVVILDDDEKFPPFGAVPEGWVVPVDASRGWHVSNEPGNYEGAFSLRSEFIDDGQTAQIEVARAFTAGNISFRLRVSSEAGFDKLRFFVDGEEKGSWSGTTASGWQLFSMPIAAGSHTLRWSYEKDGAISVGQDAAWIDAVVLP